MRRGNDRNETDVSLIFEGVVGIVGMRESAAWPPGAAELLRGANTREEGVTEQIEKRVC